ncbi:MAG: hypothetical protein Q8O22_06340 [Candidatus Omnitrophota bacterium]|nr:hypothetical protein [Candidatus Omnitrophota bacterium]
MEKNNLIQIYDLRYDQDYISDIQKATLNTKKFGLVPEYGLFGSKEWWQAVNGGVIKTHAIEGTISRVFKSGHNDYEEFEIETGLEKSSWARQTSEIPGSSLTRSQMADLYKEGKFIYITYVKQKFRETIPGLGKESECMLEIWVEK